MRIAGSHIWNPLLCSLIVRVFSYFVLNCKVDSDQGGWSRPQRRSGYVFVALGSRRLRRSIRPLKSPQWGKLYNNEKGAKSSLWCWDQPYSQTSARSHATQDHFSLWCWTAGSLPTKADGLVFRNVRHFLKSCLFLLSDKDNNNNKIRNPPTLMRSAYGQILRRLLNE